MRIYRFPPSHRYNTGSWKGQDRAALVSFFRNIDASPLFAVEL
jgi:hypothetical protein